MSPAMGPPTMGGGGPRLEAGVGEIRLTPGQPGSIAVVVRNLEFVPRTYSAALVGLDPAWVAVGGGLAALAPGASATIDIGVNLPSGFPACDYAAALRVQPMDVTTGAPAGPAITVDLTLPIGDGSLISAILDPTDVRGRERGRFRLVLRNRSQSAMRVELSAASAANELNVRFAEPVVALMPGQEARVKGAVRGHRPIFGEPRRRPFVVRVQGRSTPVVLDGSFTQKSVVSSTVVKAVMVLLFLGVWVVVLIVGLGRLSNSNHKQATANSASAPAPAPPVNGGVSGGGSNGGARGTGGGGTAGGGTGGGAAGGGSGGGGGGSAGGGSAGGGSARGAGGPVVPVGTAKMVRVSGKVKTADPSGITVTLVPTSLVNEAAQGGSGATNVALTTPIGKINGMLASAIVGQAVSPSVSTTTTPDGSWAFAGIRGPGYYRVTFAKAGYQIQSYIVSAPADGQPVQLAASLQTGTGVISGSILSPTGPLGGVDVAITDGTVMLSTRTPTTGAVGAWSVSGVSTPGTYLVTATRAGYATQTSIATLKAGGSASGLVLTMAPGQASITGTVMAQGAGVGGVTVAATNGTTTLTATTSTVAPVGSYSLPNLAIPGGYTVTISGDGWVTQTQQVNLTGNTALNATLTSTTGTISGHITGCPSAAQCAGTGTTEPVCNAVARPAIPCGLAAAGLVLANDQNTFKTVSESADPGHFALAAIPPGHYALFAEAFTYASQAAQVDILPGQNQTIDLALPFVGYPDHNAATIIGHIGDLFNPNNQLCDKDNPLNLDKVPCTITVDGKTANPPVSVSISGDYRVSGLGAGIHTIVASAGGHESVTVRASVGLNAVGFAPPALLPKLDTLSGSVTSNGPDAVALPKVVELLDQNGAPVPFSPAGRAVVTYASGHYTIANLVHGGYTIILGGDGYVSTKPMAVTLTVDQDQVLNVSLDELPRFQVTAVAPDANGVMQPITDQTVKYTVTGPSSPTQTGTIDATGTAVLSPLNVDTYQLSLTKNNAPSIGCTVGGTAGQFSCTSFATTVNQDYRATAIFSNVSFQGVLGQLNWVETDNQGSKPIPLTGTVVTLTAISSYTFPTTPQAAPVPVVTTYCVHDAAGGCPDNTVNLGNTLSTDASNTYFTFDSTKASVASPTADFKVTANGFNPFTATTNVNPNGATTPHFILAPTPVPLNGKFSVNLKPDGSGNFANITVAVTYADGKMAPVTASVDSLGNILWMQQNPPTAAGSVLPIPDVKSADGNQHGFVLKLSKPGYDDATLTVPVPLCCAITPATVTLNQLATITAQATDSFNGSVIPGATFALKDGLGNTISNPQVSPASATAGSDGTVTFSGISLSPAHCPQSGACTYTVTASAPGFSAAGSPHADVTVTAGCTCSATVSLTELGSLSGTIELQAMVGAPTTRAAATTVTATLNCGTGTCPSFSAVTDANGFFRIIGITSNASPDLGSYTVKATVPGYPQLNVTQSISGAAPTTEIHTAGPPCSTVGVCLLTADLLNISVSVKDAGGADIPGATVTAVNQISGNPYTAVACPPPAPAPACAPGTNYVLLGLPPVGYIVNVTAPGYRSLSGVGLNLQPGQSPLPILTEHLAASTNVLKGQFTFRIGTTTLKPPGLPAVTVKLTETTTGEVHTTTSDPATGQYKIPDGVADTSPLKDGTYLVNISAPGYTAPTPPNLASTGGNITVSGATYLVDDTLTANTHPVRITVDSAVPSATPTPLPNASVSLTTDGTNTAVEQDGQRTDGQGVATFSQVVPGTYTIKADATGVVLTGDPALAVHGICGDGSQPCGTTATITVAAQNNDPAPVTALIPEGKISGKVKLSPGDANHTPDKVAVSITDLAGTKNPTVASDGSFLAYVRPGATAKIDASLAGYGPQTLTTASIVSGVTLANQNPPDLVPLRHPVNVVVQSDVGPGSKVSGAAVTFSQGTTVSATCTTDSTGSCPTPAPTLVLAPGSYDIKVVRAAATGTTTGSGKITVAIDVAGNDPSPSIIALNEGQIMLNNTDTTKVATVAINSTPSDSTTYTVAKGTTTGIFVPVPTGGSTVYTITQGAKTTTVTVTDGMPTAAVTLPLP